MCTTSDHLGPKRRYRMVALDLDGTLLNSNHDVSDATVSYLRHLHSRGFVVAIATGRSAACAARIVERLDLSPVVSLTDEAVDSEGGGGVNGGGNSVGFPLVCTNGARGLRIRKSHSDLGATTTSATAAPHRSNTVPLGENTHTYSNPFLRQTLVIHEELFHNPLSEELTRKTLALANKLGCVTNYYHNHHIYALVRNEDQLELTKRYGKLTGSAELYCYLNKAKGDDGECEDSFHEGNAYGYQRAMELGPPSKLLMLCDTDKVDEITELVRKELNGTSLSGADGTQPQKQRANVIRGSPPFFVEILDPTVHKGQGLQQLCQSLSMPLEEVLAFGDGDNDLEFIKMAGCGIAMKNAREVVKAAADEVAEWTNDEDGVIRTLQRMEREGRLNFPDV